MHTHAHIHTHTCTHMHTYIHTHTHTHTYTHTHIHTTPIHCTYLFLVFIPDFNIRFFLLQENFSLQEGFGEKLVHLAPEAPPSSAGGTQPVCGQHGDTADGSHRSGHHIHPGGVQDLSHGQDGFGKTITSPHLFQKRSLSKHVCICLGGMCVLLYCGAHWKITSCPY